MAPVPGKPLGGQSSLDQLLLDLVLPQVRTAPLLEGRVARPQAGAC